MDDAKISTSFLAIQDAWQNKNLANVRKWLSDGMYQRLTVQMKMMDALQQKNVLSNISIDYINPANVYTDQQYQVFDVSISFTMDDSFISEKLPQFNEKFKGEAATEYWSFIKRAGTDTTHNLYDNNNCPNCGAPFEVKLGEISRCSNCNTLTNNATYDWVLCEITQEEDYESLNTLYEGHQLQDVMKNDPYFGIQRLEDITSNVFMQVMNVLGGGDKRRLGRFANEDTVQNILDMKGETEPFIFDRLYINHVSYSYYEINEEIVQVYFQVKATFRRISATNSKLIDRDFADHTFTLALSRNTKALTAAADKETVFSYECSTCGAPFADTTDANCTYCEAPVIDTGKNWVLTAFYR
jgi:DNA-directed RNA polymerase subunit RPC12/RpoP